jgi:chromosome segregation ATPase
MLDLPKFIRAEAQRIEAYAELVKQVDKFNGLEQAESEALARIEAANAKTAEIEAAVEPLIARAREEMADAKAEAHKALSDVRAATEGMLREATEKATAAQADALAKVKARIDEASALDAQIAAAKDELVGLQAQIGDLDPRVRDSLALIAKADAIKKAMG